VSCWGKQNSVPEHLEAVQARWPGDRRGDATELRDGRVLVVTPGLSYTVSQDGGLTWMPPAPLREQSRRADSKPVVGGECHLLRLKSGELGICYRGAGQGGPGFEFRRSCDEGVSWSPPMGLPEYRTDPDDPGSGARGARSRPVVLPSGRIIKPRQRGLFHTFFDKGSGRRRPLVEPARGYFRGRLVMVEGHAHEVALDSTFVCYSDDEGQTWRRNEDGELFVSLDYGAGGIASFEEAAPVVAPDGSVVMFGRTEMGQLFKSVSRDQGATWSQPEPSGLASSHSPAEAVRVPGSDDILLLWNQESREEISRGLRRARLSAAISSDGGRSWKHFRNLECNGVPDIARLCAGEPRWTRAEKLVPNIPEDFVYCGYPRAAFIRDFVVVTYTYSLFGGQPPEAGRIGKRGVRALPLGWFYEALDAPAAAQQ